MAKCGSVAHMFNTPTNDISSHIMANGDRIFNNYATTCDPNKEVFTVMENLWSKADVVSRNNGQAIAHMLFRWAKRL